MIVRSFHNLPKPDRLSMLAGIFVFLAAMLSRGSILQAQQEELFPQISFTDGTQSSAKFLSMDDNSIVIETADQQQTRSLESISKLVFIDSQPDSPAVAMELRLLDGSRLQAQSFVCVKGSIRLQLACGVETELKSRQVDYLKFKQLEPSIDSELKALVSQKRTADALVVLKDDKLSTIDGVLGDVTEKTVSFTVGDQTAEVKRNRITSLIFYNRLGAVEARAVGTVGLAGGSEIEFRNIAFGDDQFAITSVGGLKLTLDRDFVRHIDFGSARFQWLSDLDPTTNDWEPLLASPRIAGSLRRFSVARLNKSFMNRPLSVVATGSDPSQQPVRREFDHGIAIKGGGKIAFPLAGRYRQLTGQIGFDPDANTSGKVRFVIQVEGQTRFNQVLTASEMEQSIDFDVDLQTGDSLAKRVVILIDYEDRRSIGDVLHIVDTKLHR